MNNDTSNKSNQAKAGANSASHSQSYNGGAKQESTTVNHSLAKTIGRITEENPKRIRAAGGTIDLSRKTTKDIPSMSSGMSSGVGSQTGASNPLSNAVDLAARIAAIEKSEAQAKTNLTCRACGMAATERRLTCAGCGQYFETGVEKSVWDKKVWENPAALLGAAGGIAATGNIHDQEKLALRAYMFKRLAAKAVDLTIVASMLGLELTSYLAIAKSMLVIPSAAYLMLNFFYVGVPIIFALTILGYQAAFEASPVQATLGKFWLGLYVTNGDGENVRAEQVVFKTLISLLPVAAFLAVYSYFYNSGLKFGAHLDAPSASVLAMTALGCFATFAAMHILLGSAKKKQTVPDMVTGCVVRERE